MSEVLYYDDGAIRSPKEKVLNMVLAMGGLHSLVHPGALVLIKPNFVAPFPHATTSFEVLEAVIQAVKQCNATPVLAESSGFEFSTQKTFELLGADEFADREQVPLINLDKGRFTKLRVAGGLLKNVEVAHLALEADVIISVPKLKRHNLTRITGSIKNLLGLVSRGSRRKIHAFGLERGIFELSRAIRIGLAIVDGTVVGSRAVFGDQKTARLIIGGMNSYAVDLFCCKCLEVDYREVGHLKTAVEKGLAQENTETIYLSPGSSEKRPVLVTPKEQPELKRGAYRLAYQATYLLDVLYSRFSKGNSLIPPVHFYFGMRPCLDESKCTGCGICAQVCPVNAIELPRKSISTKLCMPVRCMRCIPACPEHAIAMRGRDVPKGFKAS